MTDLLDTIPDFPTKTYTRLLPSLEKYNITTTDLLTLDTLEIAKRAQLPLLDVRRLANHVVSALQGQLGLTQEEDGKEKPERGLRMSGKEITGLWSTISTLDESLDRALGGGIPTGYITEITGESGVGKTQILLTLLLSAQLPPPHGLSRPTLYISTEHPLPTNRLSQILQTHHLLSAQPAAASLSQVLTLQTPDLESQDHILTYQLPVALARHKIGLCIIDSIAANYREEGHSSALLAQRSAQLHRLGTLLRSLARIHDCAFVVANQVADRFLPAQAWNNNPSTSQPANSTYTPSLLTLDHQQRFFTGWGAQPSSSSSSDLKTPSLGLIWANQIACRIALIKEIEYGGPRRREETDQNKIGYCGEEASAAERQPKSDLDPENNEEEWNAEWTPRRWRRWMRVVFAGWVQGTEDGDKGVEFEVWAGGVRGVKSDSDGCNAKTVLAVSSS